MFSMDYIFQAADSLTMHRHSVQLNSEITASVPRIKETDLQIMSDKIAKGKYAEISRGYLRRNGTNLEVAYKSIQGSRLNNTLNRLTSLVTQ